MSFINFNFYSFTYEEELSVEAEVEYKEPDYNDNFSDLDFYGGYDILSLDVYHEDGELVTSTGHKQQLLGQEVRDKLNQYLRCMEIEDSRCEVNFGELNSDTVYYYEGD
ncbi:hypothetical protein [Aeromonas phage 4L372XY]|uniref:Uncharacterized protein n=1 Tax=Aeromonas phage 4L372XY TaxID=2588520 RepID=A0A5B9N8C2_9CAUD|nr:hypothetical protein HWC28_gp067 [Aeromonas phage 4L372XY]QEG08782.1 hypothetical protein [Aeromonas phage 4L372XY]